MEELEVRVCQYNLLSPTYAVKWREREGMDPEGQSNWAVRWPALLRNLEGAWDFACLQEVEDGTLEDVQAGFPPGRLRFHQHPKRSDGLAIVVDERQWTV